MKKVLMILFAAVPLTAGVLVLQSCGGQGGPTAVNSGGVPNPTAAFNNLLPAGQANATYVGVSTCSTCHNSVADPCYTQWQGTKHAANNVTCERCHGPGSAHAANPGTANIQQNPATANILTYPNVASPVVCAQCHGPIYADYSASSHNTMVEAGNNGSPGTNIGSSRCAACHNSMVRPATYDNFAISGTSTDPFSPLIITQAQVYTWSGFDTTGANYNPSNTLAHSATCVTCHNPHKVTGNVDRNGNDFQLRHMTANQDSAGSSPFANGTLVGGFGANTGPSSTVASYQTLNQACGECHNGRGATPTDANLATGTSRPNVHDGPEFNMLMGFGAMEEDGSGNPLLPTVRNMDHSTAPDQCIHCHMGDPNHSHSFVANADTSCAPCHTAADASAKMLTTQNDIINQLYMLEQRFRGWAKANPAFAAMTNPADLWDYTSLLPTGDVAPNQSLIPAAVKRARHNYHFVLNDGSLGVHNYPYATYMISIANTNLDAVGAPAPAIQPGISIAQEKADLMAGLQRDKMSMLHGGDN